RRNGYVINLIFYRNFCEDVSHGNKWGFLLFTSSLSFYLTIQIRNPEDAKIGDVLTIISPQGVESEQKLWPVHCVANTQGSNMYPGLKVTLSLRVHGITSTDSQLANSSVIRTGVRLLTFGNNDPAIWFRFTEAQFETNVTRSYTRFSHVVLMWPIEIVQGARRAHI
ncbi:hypothetical protein P879_10585, partial [Paragonimus westermani]